MEVKKRKNLKGKNLTKNEIKLIWFYGKEWESIFESL